MTIPNCLKNIQSEPENLRLVTCGLEDCAPMHTFDGINDMYILHFVYRGKGYVKDNGRLVSLSRGDIFLTEPNRSIYYSADRNIPWSYMWVGFRGSKASSCLKYAGYDSLHLFGHTDQLSRIRGHLEDMLNYHTWTNEGECTRHLSLLALLSILISEADASEPLPEKCSSEHYIEQAKRYIEGHYQEDLRVTELAASIGIDRSYLTRLFKKTLGLSPQEYILQFRLNCATQLLSDPSIKIETVARAVGYKNIASFSRMFRQVKGITPTEYRAQINEP